MRLQNHVRGNRRTQSLFTNRLEKLAEVVAPRLQKHRRVFVKAARSLVEQFGAGEIETQGADRRRRAVHDLELQERRIAAAELRAPAARRELCPGHGIGCKDGVAAAIDDFFLLTQRLLEVHDLLERETIDIDEVALGAMAPHRKRSEERR